MADKLTNEVLRDIYLDHSAGSVGEDRTVDENKDHNSRLQNDGTLVGGGVQEVIHANTFFGQLGFDKERYSYGTEESSWTGTFIDEQANEYGRDVYNDIKTMYEKPEFEDTAGFNSPTFRSFADGQATADSRSMMNDAQAQIVYNHRSEIQANHGVLDVAKLSKSEQEIMQPAVTLSQWATNNDASGTGYLTESISGRIHLDPNQNNTFGNGPRPNGAVPNGTNNMFHGSTRPDSAGLSGTNVLPPSGTNVLSNLQNPAGAGFEPKPGAGVGSQGSTGLQPQMPGYTAGFTQGGYQKAEQYVRDNHITTIQFSQKQMDILDNHGKDLRHYTNRVEESKSLWGQFNNTLNVYAKKYFPDANPKKMDADELRNFHNTVLRQATAPVLTMSEAMAKAESDYRKTNFLKPMDALTTEDRNAILSDAKARVKDSRAFHDNFNRSPLYQALSDLQSGKEKHGNTAMTNGLTGSHSMQSRRGRRLENRRIILEGTQNGATNYTGNEMVNFNRKIRTTRRLKDAGQLAHDKIREFRTKDRLDAFDRRELKKGRLEDRRLNSRDELDALNKKSVLTGKEAKRKEFLERQDKSGAKKIARIDKKNKTALLNEPGKGNYRDILEKQHKNAVQLENLHREKHTAVRNKQYMDMAGSKGLRSIHAEEDILKRRGKDLKEQTRTANRAVKKEDLLKKAKDPQRAERKVNKMKAQDARRAARRDSRPARTIGRMKGKRKELRDKFDGHMAAVETRSFRIRDRIVHNKVTDTLNYYDPRKRLERVIRRTWDKFKKRFLKWLDPLTNTLLHYVLLPVALVALCVLLVSTTLVMIPMAIGGSDPTTNNPKNEDNAAPNYYQATVTALQDYQKSYLNYYSDAAKSAAKSQADGIASKYPGYLGPGKVEVDNANIRSIINENGENSSDISDTVQALTMARVRFMGSSLGDENELPKETITNMALYMTALWVGDKDNTYIKGLAEKYGGDSGLNHQIVVNPAYNNDSETNASIHNSQGGISDSEGNQYSYIYTNYGELDDSTRDICDNIWYKDGNGNLSRNPADIVWSANTYGNSGSGQLPSALSIGNPKIKEATVVVENEQKSPKNETVAIPKKLKSGIKAIPVSTIDSEDDNNGDHFFRVNDANNRLWKNVKNGDVIALTSGKNTYVAVRIGITPHKSQGKKYPAHTNYHYTAANRYDVIKDGKPVSVSKFPSPVKLGDVFTLEDDSYVDTTPVYNGTYKDGNTIHYTGSQLKYDKASNSFRLANGNPIPMPNGNYQRSRITVTWQDGGRDGGRLIPEMDIFYVQDAQNLIKSDNWKTGDALPESKSGGIFKKHKKELETVFGKGFNPGKDGVYTLSFPATTEDGKTDDETTDQTGSEFWNKENYDINSPWYNKDDRAAWLSEHHPELSEEDKKTQSEPNEFVSFVCDTLGDRSNGYKDGTDFWDSFDVKVKQGSVNGSLSDQQAGQIAGGISQPGFGSADIEGINAQLGGEIPPGVQAMTSYALGRVGQPYVWGGFTEQYADCSGFISCIWRSRGYDSRRYTTYTLIPMAQTWGPNDRLPAGSVLVNDHHTVYVAGWNEKTQRYVVIEAMGKDYGIVVSDGTPGRTLRNTTQAALHAKFPYVITKYCTQ